MAPQAPANEKRIQILKWLKNPTAHFRPQVDGNLVKDGVCAVLLAERLRVSLPTLSEHMRAWCYAKLMQSKRIKRWTFYKRDERQIKKIKKSIALDL